MLKPTSYFLALSRILAHCPVAVYFLLHKSFFLLLKDFQQQWKPDLAIHPDRDTSSTGYSSFTFSLTHGSPLEPRQKLSHLIYWRFLIGKSAECSSFDVLTLVPSSLNQLSIRLDTCNQIPGLFLCSWGNTLEETPSQEERQLTRE